MNFKNKKFYIDIIYKGGEIVKRRKSVFIIVLLLLVGITSAYVANTYAKYSGQVSGNATATVAKWAFESDNAITTIDVDLAEAYNANRLAADRIAPGTSGSFAIELVNTNTEVGVDWTLTIGSITNKPTNLKFYKDQNHTVEFGTNGDPSNSTITGTLAAGDSNGLTVTVYWDWPYETGTTANGVAEGDAADTTNGVAGSTLTVPVTIKGVQVVPTTNAYSSGINQ